MFSISRPRPCRVLHDAGGLAVHVADQCLALQHGCLSLRLSHQCLRCLALCARACSELGLHRPHGVMLEIVVLRARAGGSSAVQAWSSREHNASAGAAPLSACRTLKPRALRSMSRYSASTADFPALIAALVLCGRGACAPAEFAWYVTLQLVAHARSLKGGMPCTAV